MSKSSPNPPKPGLAAQVGATVRRLRAAQGLTLAELAGSASISPAMLSRMERGDVSPSLDTLEQLAAALTTSYAA